MLNTAMLESELRLECDCFFRRPKEDIVPGIHVFASVASPPVTTTAYNLRGTTTLKNERRSFFLSTGAEFAAVATATAER